MRVLKSNEKTFLLFIITLILNTVFGIAQTEWYQNKKLHSISTMGNNDNQFGASVAMSKNYIIIGAQKYKEKGCAFILSNDGKYDTLGILTASDGELNDEFGCSVSINDSVVLIGAFGDDENGSMSGSVYVFEKPNSGWRDMTETARLTAPDGSNFDRFGNAVCIGNNFIIICADGDEEYRGSAYVFIKQTSDWRNMKEIAKLTPSDGQRYYNFGRNVSISNNTVLIGASGNDTYGSDRGAAYVFERPESGWADMTETAILTASDATDSDNFGRSVSISKDVVVVGSFNDSGLGYNSGSVYLFKKPESGWVDTTETAKLISSDGGYYHDFGFSVFINDNYVAAGAPGFNSEKNGSAYLFIKPDSGWENMTESAKFTPSDDTIQNNFGCSISLSDSTLVIGASDDVTNGVNSGSVYIFEKSQSGWKSSNETIKITALHPYLTNVLDYFGQSVDICNDIIVVGSDFRKTGNVYVFSNYPPYNSLGILTPSEGNADDYFGRTVIANDSLIIVGAYGDDDNGKESGSAYVFVKPKTGWKNMTETAKLKASDGQINDRFGENLSLSNNTIIIGAYGHNEYSGSAYVFEKPEDGWSDMTETAKLSTSDLSPNDHFGSSVDISDSLIIVGATNANKKGAVYIFEKPSTGWSNNVETTILTASDGEISDAFGNVVRITNGAIIICALNATINGKKCGAAYIFENDNQNWEETAKLSASDGDDFDFFGYSASISDSAVIIGAPFDKDYISNVGSAYVFVKPASGWKNMTETSKINSPVTNQGTMFGWSVSNYNNKLVIGACLDNDNGLSSGAAYVYSTTENSTNIQNTKTKNKYLHYPNPTSGEVTLELDEVYNYFEVNILANSGQLIQKLEFSGTNKANINLSGKPGIYFINVNTDTGEKATFKIIKE